MTSSPKFLRYLNRGALPIQVSACINRAMRHVARPNLPSIPEFSVVLTLAGFGADAGAGRLRIVMTPDEARSLARSLERFANMPERHTLESEMVSP